MQCANLKRTVWWICTHIYPSNDHNYSGEDIPSTLAVSLFSHSNLISLQKVKISDLYHCRLILPVFDFSMELYSMYYSVSQHYVSEICPRFYSNSSSCYIVMYSMILQLFKNSVYYWWSFGAVIFGLFPFGAVINRASMNIRVSLSRLFLPQGKENITFIELLLCARYGVKYLTYVIFIINNPVLGVFSSYFIDEEI